MDSCSTRAKPSVPPKPQFFTASKCKSLSSYSNPKVNSNNNGNALRHFGSNEEGGSSSLSLATTPLNEDVFSNNNNVGIFGRGGNDQLNQAPRAPFGWQNPLNSATALTLPSGYHPKFGNIDSIQMYRSGGTVNVVRALRQVKPTKQTIPLENGWNCPRVQLEIPKKDPKVSNVLNAVKSLEHLVPLNSSFSNDPISPHKSSLACFDPLLSSDFERQVSSETNTDLLSNSQFVDSNNNINISSIKGQVVKTDPTLGIKRTSSSIRHLPVVPAPPHARISTRRRPLRPMHPGIQSTSRSTVAAITEALARVQTKRSSGSTGNLLPSADKVTTKSKGVGSDDNLDVLIPVIGNPSEVVRKSGRNPKLQPRTQSECRSRMATTPKSKMSLIDLSTVTSPPSDTAESTVPTVDVNDNKFLKPQAMDQKKNTLPMSKVSLYLPMDRVNRDPRRNLVSSCTELSHQAKFGRVEKLISEDIGDPSEIRKQADTLPVYSKPQTDVPFSPSFASSASETFSLGSSASAGNIADDNRSSSSSDNYRTLSDDDNYISREDVQRLESRGADEVSKETMDSSYCYEESVDGKATMSHDMTDDSLSYCSSSFDDSQSRLSRQASNIESHNEIKTLILGGQASSSSPQLPPGSLSSLFFITSSTSSAASSTLSLNTLSLNSTTRSTSVDVVATASPDIDLMQEVEGRLNRSNPNVSFQQSIEGKRNPKDPFLVAKEIMTSEETFIGVLKLLNEDFPNFIQSERSQGRATDGPSDPKQLMNDLPNLQEVNKELLKQLKQRIENWDTDPRIADIFIKTGHFLKLYTSYIKNFSLIIQEFDNVRKKNPEFDKTLSEFEISPVCNRLALKHYMLKPIQRIPQYKLLLQEYLKCLSPNSPDYKNAKEAIPIVAGVSEHANESVRNWENQSKMIQIQGMLGGFQIIKPDRRFIKEGRLMKLSRKEMQARMFFLFNDLLLYTTPIGTNSFKVNQAISLDGLTVSCPSTEDVENEFSIISVERSFTVAASSKEERQHWVSALEMAVLDHMETKANLEEAIKQRRLSALDTSDRSFVASKPTISRSQGNGVVSMYESNFKVGERAPVWIQDERASMCMVCLKEFSMTFRRHHCRGCGKIVCSNCSRCRAPLKYNGYKTARVCVECFETLKLSLPFEEDNSQANESVSDAPSECLISDKDSSSVGRSSVSFGGKRSLTLLFRNKNSNPISRSLSKPSILTEVQAFGSGSELSGFLFQLEKKKWKRFWFVLKNRVLYTFRAMQDKAAIRTMPLLSYNVQDGSSGNDNDEKTFEIYHDGLPPVTLRAETCALKLKWIHALQKAISV